MSTKQAQAWYLDFLVAFMIFAFTIVIFFSQTDSFQGKSEGSLRNTVADSRAISSSLLLPGYPEDWNGSNAIRIGIADNNRLNTTKLSRFHDFNYTISRIKFGTSNDYFVFFTGLNGSVLNINGTCGTGKPSEISDPINGTCAPINITSKTELAKSERYISYNSSIIRMVVYAWH